MFQVNIQNQRNPLGSFLNNRNQNPFFKHQEGYHNNDSPLKSIFRVELSPRKSLSPIKINGNHLRANLNRSRSPILSSKQNNNYANNKKVSPFRKFQYQNNQEDHYYQEKETKNLSFTNLIRKNSNQFNDKSITSKRLLDHSNSTYLQSDRVFKEDTRLFGKLAAMLDSNQSNRSSFLKSGISQNSVKYKIAPQSCKNNTSNYNSNSKVFIRNVATVQSIQSPQERDLLQEAKYYSELHGVETNCYSEYERITTECTKGKQKGYEKELPIMRLEKKSSKKSQPSQDGLMFRKINLTSQNQQISQNKNVTGEPINFHLTNSFGLTLNLKNQIIGNKKNPIKPFEEISFQQNSPHKLNQAQHKEFLQNFDQDSLKISNQSHCQLQQSQDSVFASLKMLMGKLNTKQYEVYAHKQNQSINVSIMSDNQNMQLNMDPFLDK